MPSKHLTGYLLMASILTACSLQPKTSGEADGHAHRHEHAASGTPAHAHPGGHGGHRHDNWPEPPPAYAGICGDRWDDPRAIARGEALYRQHCQACHGAEGHGDGPVAAGLSHPPADLTHHFHTRPGQGDDYLFWRISEGGTAEPFRSQASAMPAFKSVLSEEERWDVLAYVHAHFHQGLSKWR